MKSLRSSQMTILTQKYGEGHTFAPMIVPPDGGWGWVIVLIGVLACAIIDGISYCFFLYRDPMAEELNIDKGDISFLSAIFTGFYFIGGIIACSAGNYCGFRVVMLIGASVSFTTLGTGYFMGDIVLFLIILGFIGGLASGFVMVAGVLPAGFYFDRRRSIAMGIIGSGSGIGAIVMPQVTKLFMDQYGWRLTFVFHASLCLILVIMGFLIRPLKPVMVVLRPAVASRISAWTLQDRDESVEMSMFRLPSRDSAVSTSPTAFTMGQTLQQAAHDMDVVSIFVREDTSATVLTRLNTMTHSRMLQPSVSMLAVPNISIDKDGWEIEPRKPWYKCGCCYRRHVPENPLLRTDLYYTGSLTRLREFTEKDMDIEYHMHVTQVPTYLATVQNLTVTYTSWCCKTILQGIKILLDYTLLKSPTFLCLAICAYLNYVAFFLPFLYGKIHLERGGLGEYGTLLISMLGLGNTTGRLASGLIVTLSPHFGARTAAATTTLMAGVTIICTTFYDNLIYQFTLMFIYGFTVGFFAPLRSIIIVDFFGLNKLTASTGIMILFQGLGSFSGAPLSEAVMKITNDDNGAYYVCGGSLILASIMLWPMRKLQNCEIKRKGRRI